MFSSSSITKDHRDQEFAPLLFSLSAADGATVTTPRSSTPHRGRGEDSSMSRSMSAQRRSATTPGSMQTETTPPTPPPPVLRLMDDVIMGKGDCEHLPCSDVHMQIRVAI